MKIIFFGTSDFGVPSLKILHEKFNVLKVFTNYPKPSGRGKLIKKTPIHELAESLNITVINSEKPLVEDVSEEFDIGITIAYGSIISKAVLERAKYGFLNLHPSDLPLFRGAAPIERTLEAGFSKTRVCIIKMTPKLDDGEIVISKEYQINPDENSVTLARTFSEIGATMFPLAIEKLISGAGFEKQNDALTTYAKKISKSELFLESQMVANLSGEQVLNKIRAFASYGYPFIIHENVRIKIIKAILGNEQKSSLDIKVKDGWVSPILIKPEGRNVISIEA